MDSDEEQSLEALNAARASPRGDIVVTVESQDHALLRALWTLEGEGVEISERAQKSVGDPGIVHIVLRDAASLKGTLSVFAGVFLTKFFDFIRSLNGGDKKHSKTKIRSRKFSVEVKSFALRYEDSVEVEVEQTEDDKEDTAEE